MSNLSRICWQVNMLKSLDHPHIVRVFEAFESEESLHIVMDYAEGGDLASVIRETVDTETLLPQPWVREAAVQMASALDYMHSRGVIHCDLKPGNTMLLTPFSMEDAMNGSWPHVLLVDFGLAEIFDEQVALGGPATVKGSPAYLSPEGFDGKLTQKSDTWALGVMLYEMLVGARPFRGTNNIFVLYCQVANNEPAFDKVPEVPRSLVVALMAKDPQARISARQCFDHDWLRSALSELDDHLQMPEGLGRPTSYFYRAVTFCMAAALGMKDLSRDTKLFENFDTDKSGQLDTEELKAGLARLGLRQDPSGLMAAMDLDQDGQISYTEFLAATLCLDEERGERLMRYALPDCLEFRG
ncbi:CPK2 [Symbiodinium sp. CCMP2456]|nr:CPK2 [Symbiodinium sp. CCMP2456]